jgi:hypothetical protein
MKVNVWQEGLFVVIWALIMIHLFRKKWMLWHTNFELEQSVLDQAQRLRLAQRFQVLRKNTLLFGVLPSSLALVFLAALGYDGPALAWVGARAVGWRLGTMAFIGVEIVAFTSYYRCPFCHQPPWVYTMGRKMLSLNPRFCGTCDICLDPDAV